MRRETKLVSLALFVLITSFTSITIPVVVATPDGPVFFDEMVPMSDGIKLYTRVYLPGPIEEDYPIILTRTPYGIGDPGVPPEPDEWPFPIYYEYGYVEQDTRGRFYSEGVDRLFYNDISDGYDTIDWIANRDWCDGNIGVAGYSAPGITAFMAGATNHPNLKAIAPLSSSGNLMNDLTFDGGAFRGDGLWWGLAQTAGGLSTVYPNGHVFQVLPYSEWDNIGTHMYQVYNILMDLSTHNSWHNPTLPDWPDLYPKAIDSDWWMKLPLYDLDESYSLLQPYGNDLLSHPSEDALRNHYKVYDTVSVPTLLTTGWYDFFAKCQVDAFEVLQDREVPVKILIGPGTHGTPPAIRYLEWFDYWLKGIDNGIMDEPPIYYYSLESNEWRWADQWPPEGVEFRNYYLHEGGFLSTELCANGEEFDTFTYDPMNPVLTMGGTNEPSSWGSLKAGSFDQTPVVEGRDDILSFTTLELTEDIIIAGPLKAYISASSNCLDTDFTAKLIDVHHEGELMLVADGIIRARYRNSMAEPELMSGDPADVYSFEIDLGDVCQVFKAGHRIRVDISSSNFPRYDRNLNTGGELYKESEMLIAENTVHHDSIHLSYIALPVMSPEPKVFEGCARIKIPGSKYKGPAELHTYGKAVYLHFEDQWIKWDINRHYSFFNVDIYKCQGDYGRLNVVVVQSRCGYHVVGTGRKILFISKFKK
ncbi:MAG: CocE/NonD family hydrolase [Candidatus Hodarchaeota archaeon]